MNPMLHDSISRIIRWYKGRSTKEIRQYNPDFKWHPKFHDHIIRNALAYDQIAAYIINNPMNWEKPRNF
jgi:REP element-mobilizing transposase RayT